MKTCAHETAESLQGEQNTVLALKRPSRKQGTLDNYVKVPFILYC